MTAIAVDARPDSTRPLLSVSSLAVRFGALMALAGENGAGKTTLVRCIAGDIAPTSGRILLSGKPVLAEPFSVARQGVAVVWQDLALVVARRSVGNPHRARHRGAVHGPDRADPVRPLHLRDRRQRGGGPAGGRQPGHDQDACLHAVRG